VEDLHTWALAGGKNVLTVHIKVPVNANKALINKVYDDV
jgi:Co/Zn/Cd efflux system component